MQRVYDTLDEYRKLIDKHHADTAKAVLTSAVRDAANGQEFADTVRDRYGLEPHVLTGDQEAALTFLGATSERDPDDQTTRAGDRHRRRVDRVRDRHRPPGAFHVSNQAGVVRQTERHLHSDPPTDDEIDNLAKDVRSIIETGVPPEHRKPSATRSQLPGRQPRLRRSHRSSCPTTPTRSRATCSRHRAGNPPGPPGRLPLEQRKQVRGLDPARAPTIVAGAVILGEVMRLFGLQAVEVSEHDILRGAALGL